MNSDSKSEYFDTRAERTDYLFDKLDSDPYFSSLDEDMQDYISEELVKDMYSHKTVNDNIEVPVAVASNGKIGSIGNVDSIYVENVELSEDKYSEIKDVIKDEFRNIDSNNFDPEDELMERVAFRLIGKDYVEPSANREDLFLSDWGLYDDFSNALVEAEAGYIKWNRNERGIHRESPFSKLFSSRDVIPEEEGKEREPIVVEDDESFLKKYKKAITLGLIGILGVAGYAGFRYYTSPEQELKRNAEEHGVSEQTASNFHSEYPDMVDAYLGNELIKPLLELYEQNSTLFEHMYNASVNDERVIGNSEYVPQSDFLPKSTQLAMDTGAADMGLNKRGVWTLGNLTLAYNDKQWISPTGIVVDIDALSRHDNETVKDVLRYVTKSGDLADFEPVVIEDARGRTIEIGSEDVPRDHWIITEFLKQRPDIGGDLEKHEWINTMLKQVAYNLFDEEYHYYGNLKSVSDNPESEDVWDIILDFHDYMNELPNNLERDDIGVTFPYHDSELLKNYISNEADRELALMYLANLPTEFWNKTHYESEYLRGRNLFKTDGINRDEFKTIIEDAKRNSYDQGMEAIKMFLDFLPKEYEEIVNARNSSELINSEGKIDSLYGKTYNDRAYGNYNWWLKDRMIHGLWHTVGQFHGFNDSEIEDLSELYYEAAINRNATEANIFYKKLLEKNKGIDEFILDEFEPWELIRFIIGYEDVGYDWGGEMNTYIYGYPLGLKSMGIPYTIIHKGTGKPDGTGSDEWAVPVPDDVKDKLSEKGLVIGRGNMLSLYSCVDGLEKDGIFETTSDGTFQPYNEHRLDRIYNYYRP